MPTIDVKQIRKIIEANPDILNAPKPGRKKGSKVEPIPVLATVEAEPEEVIEVSYSKAKAMGIKTRKPRQLSEESKAKMYEALAKGREKLREKQEIKRAEKEAEKDKPKVKEINLVKEKDKPTKKILIKPKKKYVKKAERINQHEENTTSEDEETQEEPITESESTDIEIKKTRRKVAKKVELLKDIDSKISTISSQANIYNTKYGRLF